MLEGKMRREEVLWLLGSLSQLYRLPFDAGLVAQQFPPPYSLATFYEAARALGFKTGTCKLAGLDWQKLPLPVVAFLQPEQAASSEGHADDITTSPPPLFSSSKQTPQSFSFFVSVPRLRKRYPFRRLRPDWRPK
jgi:hypothetical protein